MERKRKREGIGSREKNVRFEREKKERGSREKQKGRGGSREKQKGERRFERKKKGERFEREKKGEGEVREKKKEEGEVREREKKREECQTIECHLSIRFCFILCRRFGSRNDLSSVMVAERAQ